MKKRMRIIGIVLLVLSNAALVAIWAINGYEETWFYAVLLIITIPTSWIHFIKKDKDR